MCQPICKKKKLKLKPTWRASMFLLDLLFLPWSWEIGSLGPHKFLTLCTVRRGRTDPASACTSLCVVSGTDDLTGHTHTHTHTHTLSNKNSCRHNNSRSHSQNYSLFQTLSSLFALCWHSPSCQTAWQVANRFVNSKQHLEVDPKEVPSTTTSVNSELLCKVWLRSHLICSMSGWGKKFLFNQKIS